MSNLTQAQIDDLMFDASDGECSNCGGEGRVAGTCIDGCCAEQDDPDCEFCSHRCDVCGGKGYLETDQASTDQIGAMP